MKKTLMLMIALILLVSCFGPSEPEKPFSESVSREQADILQGAVMTQFKDQTGARGSWSQNDEDWIINKQGDRWLSSTKETKSNNRVKVQVEWDGQSDKMKLIYVEIGGEIKYDNR